LRYSENSGEGSGGAGVSGGIVGQAEVAVEMEIAEEVAMEVAVRSSVKANVVRTTHATASAFWTRSVRAFAIRTQRVSYRCRVSRQMRHAMASAF